MSIESSQSSRNKGGEDKIILHSDCIENEIRLQEKLFYQQNNWDEKIANNMLKLNVFIYLVTLMIITVFIFFSDNVFNMLPPEDEERYVKLEFSLIAFTQVGNGSCPQVANVTNYYGCIYDMSDCRKSNDCRNVNLAEILRVFDIDCSQFRNFSIAGIVLIIGLSLGGFMSVVSLITVSLILLKKISLDQAEVITTFSKFESLVYLVFMLEYLIQTGIIFNPHINMGIALFSLLVIIFISVANYFCFRTTFYNKLRINARINFNSSEGNYNSNSNSN